MNSTRTWHLVFYTSLLQSPGKIKREWAENLGKPVEELVRALGVNNRQAV